MTPCKICLASKGLKVEKEDAIHPFAWIPYFLIRKAHSDAPDFISRLARYIKRSSDRAEFIIQTSCQSETQSSNRESRLQPLTMHFHSSLAPSHNPRPDSTHPFLSRSHPGVSSFSCILSYIPFPLYSKPTAAQWISAATLPPRKGFG